MFLLHVIVGLNINLQIFSKISVFTLVFNGSGDRNRYGYNTIGGVNNGRGRSIKFHTIMDIDMAYLDDDGGIR